jgi:hypothetical protein
LSPAFSLSARWQNSCALGVQRDAHAHGNEDEDEDGNEDEDGDEDEDGNKQFR